MTVVLLLLLLGTNKKTEDMSLFFSLLLSKVGTAPTPTTTVLTYTATQKVNPLPSAFNVSMVSNTFTDGVGTIVFDGVLTTIGYRAFYNSSALNGVTIPSSVTSIGNSAFSNSGITSLHIPSGVTSIGEYMCCKCTNLTSVTFDTDSAVTTIPDCAFRQCAITDITLPSSVTTIGSSEGDVFLDTPLATLSIYNSSSVVRLIGSLPSSIQHIYVPYYMVNAYKSAWSSYASKISAL